MKRQALEKVREIKDTHIQNIEAEDKEFRIPCGLGLYFRVSPTRKITWQVRFKDQQGKWKWLSIGSYPKISLAEARLKCSEVSVKLNNNEEILSSTAKLQKNLIDHKLTFKDLLDTWLNHKHANWAPQTFKKEKQSIEKWLFPTFENRDFRKISSEEWLDFFLNLQREEKIYNRIKKLVTHTRSAYDLAKFKGQVILNPLDGINKYLDKTSNGNMKHVQIEELPKLLKLIQVYSNRSTSIALELLVLLFPRPQELRLAKWEDFDLQRKLWIKPAETMKCGIRHVVPLPMQAVKLIKLQKELCPVSKYLFTSRDSLSEPMSEATLNNALKNIGYRGKQSPHGFRHIASTALNTQFAGLGQVVEASLAHKKPGVKATYDKSIHLEDRIMIMQWWADYLTNSVSDEAVVD
jgi:integrase